MHLAKKISMTQACKQFSDALAGALNQVNIVTQCVKACRAHFGGDVPPKEDCVDFADKVAELRGWSEASVKARKSEVRKVVRNYTRMESACKAVAAKGDSFTWHNAIKVARILNKNPKLSDAGVVKAFFDSAPSNHATPKQKAMKALKGFMGISTTAKDVVALQSAVQKVLDDEGIEL
jgi:hypothetical protein